jgi:hypothetical protein
MIDFFFFFFFNFSRHQIFKTCQECKKYIFNILLKILQIIPAHGTGYMLVYIKSKGIEYKPNWMRNEEYTTKCPISQCIF